MIINPRGTSGSGKSTLVRRIVEVFTVYADCVKRIERVAGRRQPLFYEYRRVNATLFVLGHYETACGGCDTLPSYEATFKLARELAPEGDVLMEGLLLSADARHTLEFYRWLEEGCQEKLHVLQLTTPLAQCVANIQARRAERGDERPINPKNTESKYKGIRTTVSKLAAGGIQIHTGSFDEMLAKSRELLGV